jgi:predicted O-methyltransferase YrrM
MKLTKQGKPLNPGKKVQRVSGKVSKVCKVKEHTDWCNEEKPWGAWLYKSLHGSVESHYLYRTAKILGAGNYANLGVFRGGTVNCIAQGIKASGGVGKVYGIDLFDVNGAFTPEKLMGLYKEHGVEEYVELCTGYTNEWPAKLSHLKFKLIFIDADHHYETCKQDFDLWKPLLEEGGLIAFHDVDMDSVDKVITEALNDGWELVDHNWKTKTIRRKT